MKKIAIVIADLELGGGQRSALNLASALKKNYEVTMILMQDDNSHFDMPTRYLSLDCPRSENLFVKIINVFKRRRMLSAHFREEKYDYIFSFMETANYPTVLADSSAVLSVHCDPHELGILERILMRLTYNNAQHVIAVSEDVASMLRKDFGLRKVSRIYNLVSFDDILTQGAVPYKHTRPYIMGLGRLNEVKRFDLLIDAYAKSKMRVACDLLIVGEGDQRPALEAQIERLGLQNNVILTGVKSNPFKYLAGAEFMVLSSRTEAFPMVLIESLVLGCPTIAVDCPTGPREIVLHEKNGLLIPMGDLQAITDGLDRLYSDRALLEECRANALESVQHLSADEVVKQWLKMGESRAAGVQTAARAW